MCRQWKKGSPRFTACNQMQMGPWSLSEGSLYHGKYRFFFLIFFFVPSTFREMMPTAIAVGNPLSWLWDTVFSWPGLVDTADQRCYPLSQVPLFNTVVSCWLKHFPCTLLSACLTVLSQAQCVCEEVPQALCLSCQCVRYECDKSVWSSETFWKPLQCSAVFQALCWELIKID